MRDKEKTKDQLINELAELRQRNVNLETRESSLELNNTKQNRLIEQLREKINKHKDLGEMEGKYEFIVNNAKEFMTLINSDYIYEAANDSYCFAHNKKREEIIGKTAANIWGKETFNNVIHKCLNECLSGSEVHYQEWFDFPGLGKRYFDVRYYPYYNNEAVVTHAVVVTHDITEHKIAEEELKKHRDHLEEMVKVRTNELEKSNRQLQNEIIERKRLERKMEKLIKDLKTALTNVKRLRGLIPICANCKKIRDDEGYWKEVESYIHEHSDAEFTHGICPDCIKKLYPQYYDKNKT